MSISNIYDNIGRQTARREQLEEEWQKQALQNAVLEYLPAYASRDNWRLGVELGEEVVIANANEWQQKANQAAAQAEEYAQGAMRAETRGDMEVASILWGDSWSYDQKAQNYSAEAARYEAMRPNTAPTPVFTAPNTAPKPMSMNPAQTPKSTTPPSAPPGAATQGELAAGQEKAAWAVPDKGRQENAPASIHAGRIALEQDLNRLRSELQMYSELSGGKGEPWILGWYADQIHDVMKAMEALPAEPVREDIFLQALKGNYYTGQPTPEGAAAQMALGMSGLDFPMDIRDLSYDLTHLKTVAPGQLAIDAAALLPFVGGLKYADEAAALWKQGLNAAEAAGDMTKQVDELVDAGKAAAHLAESGTAAAEGTKLTDRIMEAGQRANKTLAATGNVGYSSPVIETVSPQTVRFSQRTVNGSAQMVEDMKINGWHGEPIDVVKMPDGGLTAVDNTRLRAANITDTDVLIRVHDFNEPLPMSMLERFGNKKTQPSTWGDAVGIRINDQGATFRINNPCGTFELPKENNFKYSDIVK